MFDWQSLVLTGFSLDEIDERESLTISAARD